MSGRGAGGSTGPSRQEVLWRDADWLTTAHPTSAHWDAHASPEGDPFRMPPPCPFCREVIGQESLRGTGGADPWPWSRALEAAAERPGVPRLGLRRSVVVAGLDGVWTDLWLLIALAAGLSAQEASRGWDHPDERAHAVTLGALRGYRVLSRSRLG